jgi:outer membrane protein TolC
MSSYKIIQIGLLKAVCLVLLAGAVNAQDVSSLSENTYKQTVVKNNYLIMAAEASLQAANKNIDAIRKDLYPSLDFFGTNRYFDERVTSEGMPTLRQNFFSVGLNLYQNVYSGGIVRKNKKLAEIYAAEAMAGKELTKNDMLYLASLTYWTAVSAKEELGIWKAYRGRFAEFYKTVNDRVEEGIASKNELLTTQVQLNEIDLHILQAEKTLQVAKLNLKKLACLPADMDINLIDSIIINTTLPDTVNILEEALTKRPEVKLLEQQVLAGEQKEKIAAAKYGLNLGVSLGGNFSNGLVEKPDGDFHYNVMATASWPIVRWGKKRDEMTVQNFYTQSVRQQLREQELGVKFDIAEAYFNLEQSIKQVTLSMQATVEARENLRIYVDRYDEGLASIIEVTEAQTFLQNAIILLFKFRANYQLNLIEYDQATGRL